MEHKGRVWNKYLQQHHVQAYAARVYHQQANPVERRIQELKKVLRANANEHPTEWARHLSAALFALRNRTNAATGMSPSTVLFDQELRRPGEWSIPREVLPPRQQREDRVAKAQRRQEVYQRQVFPEPKIPQRRYQVGDMVMTRARPTKQRSAFGPKWTGPHPVMEVLGETVYMIDQNGNAQAIT